jgi:hypothetical protein
LRCLAAQAADGEALLNVDDEPTITEQASSFADEGDQPMPYCAIFR